MKDRSNDEAMKNILANRLMSTMRERGDTPIEAAGNIGIGYAYLMSLLRGERRMSDASKQTLARIARYLQISTVQAYFWSGAILAEDFLVEETADSMLDKTYRDILEDTRVAHLAVPLSEWQGMSRSSKMLVAGLYGMAVGLQVIPDAELPLASEPSTEREIQTRSETRAMHHASVLPT